MKFKIIIIITLIFLICLLILRQVPYCAMRGFCQGMGMYYQVVTLQNFAKEHNKMFFPKLYKSEVEKYMQTAIPTAEKGMDKTISEANELYNDYLKNTAKRHSVSEYSEKFYDFESELDTYEFQVYVEIFDITDKYLLIPFGGLPTDSSGAFADIFYPYFKKYNVDYSGLIEFDTYYDKKQKELNKIKEKFDNLN